MCPLFGSSTVHKEEDNLSIVDEMAVSFIHPDSMHYFSFLSDMEKFPVRMKDNDLLVTQLFEDPCKDSITALSVYVTPNVCKSEKGGARYPW